MGRSLPAHLVPDLIKIIIMQVLACYVLWTSLMKLYDINLLDYNTTYGRAFMIGIVGATFVGIYTTLSTGENLRALGAKVLQGQD